MPRKAFCTGCARTFHQMHKMINHRRLDRCGGRFLPSDERVLIHAMHWARQNYERVNTHEAQQHYNSLRVGLQRARHDRRQEEIMRRSTRFIKPRLVFGIDYTDLQQVKILARKFGKGHAVIKHPDRPNYNIVHASRTDLYEPDWVVFQT